MSVSATVAFVGSQNKQKITILWVNKSLKTAKIGPNRHFPAKMQNKILQRQYLQIQ